jgi:HEAT repeat protein
MRLATLFALLVLAATPTGIIAQKSAPPDLKGKSLKQTFDDLLPGMAGGGKNDAQQRWQEICFALSAPGNEALRTEACKLMGEKLDPKTPTAARVWLLKQLERIGREECVDAVAALLDDKDELLRDGAIRCLANNPAPQATAKLVARLPGANGKAKVGLLNALGHRNDKSALDAVARELTSAEQPVAIAAARVLGKFGTPEAAKAVAGARTKAQGEVRLALSDAYLRCADQQLQQGKTAEAAAIYKELHKPEEPKPIQLAALQGVLRTAGDQAGPMILDILGGNDAAARAIAIGQIENLTAGALKPLAANLDKLPITSQVLVINAIAARGDKSQLTVALAAMKSTNDSIKRAGIQALGRLGDASVVPPLIETLLAGGALGSAAGDSLAQLTAEGVNEKLIAALEAEKTPARIGSLIGVLERRKAPGAVPAVLKLARSDDAAVRTSAFAGLQNLAEPKHIPEMVLALLKTDKSKDRAQAELAIVAIAGQIGEADKRAEPVLALLNDGAQGQQAALLPLLGRLGGPRVLPLVKDALASSNAELYESGVVALCNWPEPSVSDELLKLAKDGKQEGQRLLALRAVIRVNTIPQTDRPNEARLASLAALQKAMELASRDEERKLLLEGIGFVRTIETFRYVLPYLDNKDLAQAACKGIVELAHSRPLREANKAEFDKALDRVIAICKDKGLVDRARQYKLGQ